MPIRKAVKPDSLHPGGDAEGPAAHLRTESGQRIELRPNRLYILGRGEMCDLRTDDPGCSRRHAKISVAGDITMLFLQDMGSKNGTYCNDARVDGRQRLRDGDTVRIGSTNYHVRIRDGTEGEEIDTRTTMFKKK